jgi:hypothetical protein
VILFAPFSRSSRCEAIAGAIRQGRKVTALKSGWLFPDKMEIRAHDWTPGPSIERRTTMSEYIGLDMPLKEAALSVRRDRKRIWRGKCSSGPSLVVSLQGRN